MEARAYTPETIEINKRGYSFKRLLDISWGAVFAGWLVAATVAMILYAIGSAAGITAVRFNGVDPIDSKIAITTGIWLLVTWIISLSLGSYFAARVVRTVDSKVGGYQGIAIWALSNILTILVGVAGLGTVGLVGVGVAGANGELIGSSLMAAASAEEQARYKNPASFQARLKQELSPNAPANIHPDTVALISREFIEGDKESARSALVLNTNLTRAQADTVVNNLSQQAAEVKAKAKLMADKVAECTSHALWFSALISLLSLLGAYLAGNAGVRNYLRTDCGHAYDETETVSVKR